MTTDEIIKKYFGGMDGNSSVPLYQQLKEKAAAFIESNPDNTMFPSERDLSATLNLNRRTVRKALEEFIAEGILERSQKGTFLRKKEKSARPFSIEDIHPLNFAMGFQPVRKKRMIRISLFENMPLQVEFWKNTVNDFNRLHPEIEAVLEWMDPKNLTDLHEALKILPELDADLIQLPVTRIWEKEMPFQFAPPSEQLQSVFRSDSFRIEKICSTYPDMLKGAVPFAAGFRMLTCNMDLLNKLGCKETPQDFRDFAHLKFPDGIYLCDHIACILETFGFRLSFRKRDLQHYLAEALRVFGDIDFQNHSICTVPPESPGCTYYQNFIDGKLLLTPNGSGGMLRFIEEQASFRMKHILPLPLEGHFAQMNCNLFGISRKTKIQAEAEEFLMFLLSEEIQKRFAQDGYVPMRKSMDPILAEILKVTNQELQIYLDSGSELPFFYDQKYYYLLELFRRLQSEYQQKDLNAMIGEIIQESYRKGTLQ